MRNKRTTSCITEFDDELGVISLSGYLYEHIHYFAKKNLKKHGEAFYVTSIVDLAKHFKRAEVTVRRNLKNLSDGNFIKIERSMEMAKVSNGHLCNLKITALRCQENVISVINEPINVINNVISVINEPINVINEPINVINNVINDPLQAASSKGFKNENLSTTIVTPINNKEIYKEKIAIETGVEKKSAPPPTEKTLDEQFDEWWGIYPKRSGGSPKIPAKRAFIAALSKKKSTPGQEARGTPTFAELLAKTKLFADRKKTEIAAEKKPQKLAFLLESIPMAATWLNQDRWLDDTEPEAQQQVEKSTAEIDPNLKGFLASNRAIQANHAWILENTKAEISLDSVKLFCENAYQRSLLANYQDHLSSYFSKPVMIFASEAEAQEAMAKPKLSAPVQVEAVKPERSDFMGKSQMSTHRRQPPVPPDAPRESRLERLMASFGEKLNNAMVASNLEITTAYPEEKRYG